MTFNIVAGFLMVVILGIPLMAIVLFVQVVMHYIQQRKWMKEE